MPRTTNVPPSKARRNKRHKLAKSFRGRNKNTNRITAGVVKRSLANQFVGRKLRKRDMRSLWITRIGIAARLNGTTYATLMDGLKKAGIGLNRKMLADLAVMDSGTFSELTRMAHKSASA